MKIILNGINQRIGLLIEELGITKTAFAEKFKVTQQYISKLVKTGTPSDMFIDNICREFGVNEVWLRTGEGGVDNMFTHISVEDQYSLCLGKLTVTENKFIQNALIALAETTPEKLKVIEDFMKKCIGIS